MKTCALSLALCSLSTLSAWGQDAWVVDDDGGAGVDFTDLQPAIDAASDGDLVLVRTGSYAPFTLSAKGLALVADEGADVVVEGAVGAHLSLVTGIAANQSVKIRGLTFVPPLTTVGDLVRLESSAGLIWLEDVLLDVAFPQPFGYSMSQTQALRIDGCDEVVLTRATVFGLQGTPPGQGGLETGSMAISMDSSTAHLFDCLVAPGSTLVLGGFGRQGIRADDSTLVLTDCEVFGGTGGEAGFLFPGPGTGGPGVQLGGGEVWSIASSVVGGLGGNDFFGGGSGPPGVPFSVIAGTLSEHAGSPVALDTERVVRDGVATPFQVTAEPASPTWLLVKIAPQVTFSDTLPATLATGLSPILFNLGATDAQGLASLTSPGPSLPPAFDFRDFVFQAAAFTPSTGFEFSNASILTLVQQGF